ncbi:MAG: MBL fold metallo-hydrolase [Thermoplasmata archaeon]|nr:MBL fold metallo-hydrolase [Thermoplasmata archaeon]
MVFNYCILGSGSRGNSMVVWDEENLLLVDAGFSGKEIKKRMGQIGLDPDDIDAIIISHDHGDHVKGASIMSRRHEIPIYATELVQEGRVLYDQKLSGRQIIGPDESFAIGGFNIRGFEVPHYANQTLGFRIENGGKTMAIATDMGHVPAGILPELEGCNGLVLEANHDLDMLVNGPYLPHLKRQIMSENGHLPNVDCGETLAKVIGEDTKHVTLAHLSGDNNEPEVAMRTIKAVLDMNKVRKVKIITASQSEKGDVIAL